MYCSSPSSFLDGRAMLREISVEGATAPRGLASVMIGGRAIEIVAEEDGVATDGGVPPISTFEDDVVARE